MNRLRNEPEGVEEFYEMLGRAASLWARFENTLTHKMWILMNISPPSRALIEASRRRGFTGRIETLVSCFKSDPGLVPYSHHAEQLEGMAKAAAKNRNMLVHGSFWGFCSHDPLTARFQKLSIEAGQLKTEQVDWSVDDLIEIAKDADNMNTGVVNLGASFARIEGQRLAAEPE